MKSFPNIEKSVVKKGEYVGYNTGVWRIQRSTSSYGTWWAWHTQRPAIQVYGWSLEMISRRIAETTVML